MRIGRLSISEAEAILDCFGAYNESESELDSNILTGLNPVLSRVRKEDIFTLKSIGYYEYLLNKLGL